MFEFKIFNRSHGSLNSGSISQSIQNFAFSVFSDKSKDSGNLFSQNLWLILIYFDLGKLGDSCSRDFSEPDSL